MVVVLVDQMGEVVDQMIGFIGDCPPSRSVSFGEEYLDFPVAIGPHSVVVVIPTPLVEPLHIFR